MKRKLPDLNPRPSRKRTLSDEERELWQEAVEGKKKRSLPAPKKEPAVSVSRPVVKSKSVPLPPLAPGNYTGMDRRTANKLRKGKLDIEATLDLHGMTQEKAHHALIAFIDRAASRGKRLLLVITGKGGRLGEKPRGVLRAALPEWLAKPALRPRILAVTPAAAKDGGDGAFYVLLRRGPAGGGH